MFRLLALAICAAVLSGCERSSPVDETAVAAERETRANVVTAGAQLVSRTALSFDETVTIFLAPYSDGVLVQRIPCVVYQRGDKPLMHCASPEIFIGRDR